MRKWKQKSGLIGISQLFGKLLKYVPEIFIIRQTFDDFESSLGESASPKFGDEMNEPEPYNKLRNFERQQLQNTGHNVKGSGLWEDTKHFLIHHDIASSVRSYLFKSGLIFKNLQVR
jgi:hypothetical protein